MLTPLQTFHILDEELRKVLLTAFYDFEQEIASGKVSDFEAALKPLNLTLLKAFLKKGLQTYKTIIYAPYGKNVPLQDVIKAVQGA